MAEALTVNTNLQSLFIHENSIGEGGKQRIQQALVVHPSLTELEMDGSNCDQVLERNKHNQKMKQMSLFELLLPEIG